MRLAAGEKQHRNFKQNQMFYKGEETVRVKTHEEEGQANFLLWERRKEKKE